MYGTDPEFMDPAEDRRGTCPVLFAGLARCSIATQHDLAAALRDEVPVRISPPEKFGGQNEKRAAS